jgi:alkylation response protein AidB-like acyl-CoA dehydrogenase
VTSTDPVSTTRALFDLIDGEAPTTEAEATLSTKVVDAFHEHGLFGLMIPKELGGAEADLVTSLEVYEEASRADGSAGWSLLANATTSAFAAAYCGDRAVEAMFGGDRFPTHAGQFSPRGTALLQPDGNYLVAGRYSFGSGSGHSNWMGGGAIEMREVDGAPEMVMAPSGLPVIRAYFVPREAVEFLGNWDVMGLTGTGSYDYEVPEQVVEAEFTFDLINAVPQRGGPVYRLGVMGLTAIGHAAFALGVGRRALDEMLRVLETKHRLGAAAPLRDQQKFRYEFAHHDAALCSARAFVYESFASVQDTLFAGDDPTPVQRARLRQSTTHVTHVAEEVVRFAYTTAGTDALRPGALQRCFRDIHAATQHLVVDDSTFVDATAVLLDQA